MSDPNLAELQRLDLELARARGERDLYRELHQNAEKAFVKAMAELEEAGRLNEKLLRDRSEDAATIARLERERDDARADQGRGMLAGMEAR